MKTTKQTLQPPSPHRYRLSIQGQINFVLCPLHWSRDISVNGPNTIFSRKHRAGVDIHSCSQFLLELYSQWLIPGSSSNRKTPTILISEVVRSVGWLHTFSCFCSPKFDIYPDSYPVLLCSCWQCQTCSQRGTNLI